MVLLNNKTSVKRLQRGIEGGVYMLVVLFYFCILILIASLLTNHKVMSDNERVWCTSLTVISIVAICVILTTIVTSDTKEALNNCQQHLPRSEKCVMIAVPEYEINKGE